MTIETITLGQFQELHRISKSDMEIEDKETEMVAVITGKTVNEVELMTVPEFQTISREINQILQAPIPEAKASRTICGIGITYEPARLNRGQYVTVNHFTSKDVIENAHNILAAISYDTKTGKHEADKHADIAERLQDAKLVDVLPTCLFFCQLFESSMKGLQNFLIQKLIAKGVKPMTAYQTITTSIQGLGGFITQNRSQTSKT